MSNFDFLVFFLGKIHTKLCSSKKSSFSMLVNACVRKHTCVQNYIHTHRKAHSHTPSHMHTHHLSPMVEAVLRRCQFVIQLVWIIFAEISHLSLLLCVCVLYGPVFGMYMHTQHTHTQHTHTHTHTHTHKHTHTHVCVCLCVHLCGHKRMHIYVAIDVRRSMHRDI